MKQPLSAEFTRLGIRPDPWPLEYFYALIRLVIAFTTGCTIGYLILTTLKGLLHG